MTGDASTVRVVQPDTAFALSVAHSLFLDLFSICAANPLPAHTSHKRVYLQPEATTSIMILIACRPHRQLQPIAACSEIAGVAYCQDLPWLCSLCVSGCISQTLRKLTNDQNEM